MSLATGIVTLSAQDTAVLAGSNRPAARHVATDTDSELRLALAPIMLDYKQISALPFMHYCRVHPTFSHGRRPSPLLSDRHRRSRRARQRLLTKAYHLACVPASDGGSKR
jgi:hypothetical protein